MNFAAFNFHSCQPCGRLFALVALLFCVTAEAKMPAACVVTHAAGEALSTFHVAARHPEEIKAASLPTALRSAPGVRNISVLVVLFGVNNAALARGRQGGTPFSYKPKNQNGRPVVKSPFAAMAVSAAIHPELRRA